MFPKLLHKSKRRDGPKLHGEPVTMRELRDYVFGRDRVCVAWMADERHECRDPWGNPHGPLELAWCQLAHVPDSVWNVFGRKAPDDELHTVTECAGANAAPSRELRKFEREWIARHELAPRE